MFYLTYYEEYPIYEPAEGGYYYAGCSAEEWVYDEDLSEILKYLPEYLEKHGMKFWITKEDIIPIFERHGAVVVAMETSKYIGEDKFIRLENENEFKSEECGWHPYE